MDESDWVVTNSLEILKEVSNELQKFKFLIEDLTYPDSLNSSEEI